MYSRSTKRPNHDDQIQHIPKEMTKGDGKMKNTSRCMTGVITAATVAISLLIGAAISEAMQSRAAMNRAGARRSPAIRVQSCGVKSSQMAVNRARAMRVPAIRAQLFGGKSSQMAVNRAVAKRVRVVGVQSFERQNHQLLPGPALSSSRALQDNTFGTVFQEPLHFPGRTIRPPSERIPDPSDIQRMDDLDHVPGRDMIDSRYLGGPDRSPDGYVPDPKLPGLDYDMANSLSDMSSSDCLWDAATWDKVSHWGGGGGPLIGDTTSRNYWVCPDKDTDQDGGNKGSGGKDTSGSESGTKETAKEAKVVKESTTKPDGKKDGPEGDDPDELGSPIAQQWAKRIEMVSLKDSIDSRSGNSGISSLSPTGTNTPRGLPHGREQRLGPNHKNRPDATGSPVSSMVMANPMGYAASPTPDGNSNPPPGPEFNPVASAKSTAAGSTIMATPVGYAASPAVGTDGKDSGPSPGPEF
jgi:hypothetical protein